MEIRFRIASLLCTIAFGVNAQATDHYEIKLNPGEKIIAINGVPVEQLGINPDGTRMKETPKSGEVVTASASAPKASSSAEESSASKESSEKSDANANNDAIATNIVGNLVRSGQPFSHTPGETALEKANHERRMRGMGPLTPDPALQQLALQKATIAASRGIKNHIGGSLGGARAEGVGHTNGRFLSCCLDMPATYGGAAMVQGRDGWYCCLLVR